MKIAFLVSRLDKPSTRYRVLQYIPLLTGNDLSAEVHLLPRQLWRRLLLFAKLRHYQVVFLQKKLLGPFALYALRQAARRLVFDFDDAVMFNDSNKDTVRSKKRESRFVRTVRSADAVVAGNAYLRDLAARENPAVHTIPTPIDMARYTGKPLPRKPGPLVLGWIGSSATLIYLERMRATWDALAGRYPQVVIKIVADRFCECGRMPVITKHWRYDDEIADLHSFDIGLMPLTDDPWARGKCGFKMLQYMAVGVPAVCSPVGVNREIVTDGVNGYHATTPDEWIDKIGRLIDDDELRARMGAQARETVLRRYSLEVNSAKLIALFHSLAGGP